MRKTRSTGSSQVNSVQLHRKSKQQPQKTVGYAYINDDNEVMNKDTDFDNELNKMQYHCFTQRSSDNMHDCDVWCSRIESRCAQLCVHYNSPGLLSCCSVNCMCRG